MKNIVIYLKDYIAWIDKRIFIFAVVFISISIFANYYWHLNDAIDRLPFALEFTGWYLIFLAAFSFAYFLSSIFHSTRVFQNKKFILLLLIAPLIFAWKMSYNLNFPFSFNTNENAYWNAVAYWPFKLVVIIGFLLIIWKLVDKEQPFYGTTTKDFNTKPYFLMLVIMIPLIVAASTQPDFLAMYPKLKNIQYLSGKKNSGFYKLLYELSYGSDFVGIELFFRGFLILAFAKFAGRHAILPMALFYCTIHFGKPLGECISSFFGGIILGVVTYHTRTIWGGLIVHLGIAWLMELGGCLGNIYK